MNNQVLEFKKKMKRKKKEISFRVNYLFYQKVSLKLKGKNVNVYFSKSNFLKL